MKKILVVLLVCFFTLSCNKGYYITEMVYDQEKMDNSHAASDPVLENIVLPYRESLETSMGSVLAIAAKDLSKAKPESELGNLLSDATLVMARKYTKGKVDLAIINYGGIRVPSISKGEVTLGNVYEVMPFDNYLVTLDIDGASLVMVLNQIAKSGGWPISGVQFTIKEGTANDIRIGNKPMDTQKIYTLAISDYLANGGDNMTILKSFEQKNTNVLLRDAFITYFKSISDKNELLDANLENRISNE